MKLLDYEMLCALESRNIQQALDIIGEALQVQLPLITDFKYYGYEVSAREIRVWANGNIYKWIEGRGFKAPGRYSLDMGGGVNWVSFWLNKKS
jgi:hypothetical protein